MNPPSAILRSVRVAIFTAALAISDVNRACRREFRLLSYPRCGSRFPRWPHRAGKRKLNTAARGIWAPADPPCAPSYDSASCLKTFFARLVACRHQDTQVGFRVSIFGSGFWVWPLEFGNLPLGVLAPEYCRSASVTARPQSATAPARLPTPGPVQSESPQSGPAPPSSGGNRSLRSRTAWSSGVSQTLIGHPPCPVAACTFRSCRRGQHRSLLRSTFTERIAVERLGDHLVFE